MSGRIVLSALSLSFVAASATGCAYAELRTVLRAQFASELDCPEVKIEHRELWYSHDGPDQYKISGCGVVRTYTCPDPKGLVSYDEKQCEWVEGDADAPTKTKLEAGSILDEAAEDSGDGPGSDDTDDDDSDDSDDSDDDTDDSDDAEDDD